MKTTKFIVIAAAVATVLYGCSSPSLQDQLDTVETQIEELQIQADSLRVQIAREEGDTTGRPDEELVTFYSVDPQSFTHYIDIQGVAESDKNVLVASEIGGTITSVAVTEGQSVGSGQVLVRTDNSILNSNLQEVNTALELATSVYERQKRLYDQNIGSELQYLEAKNNKERLEKQVQTLNAQLAKSSLKSPISGYVDEVIAKVGESASPGMPLVRIVNMSSIKIEADIPERYVNQVKKNSDVDVFFPAMGEEVKGKVASVGQVIDPANRTFKVHVSIDNNEGRIKPNLLAEVHIKDFEMEKALVIPTKLVQDFNGEKFVFVAIDAEYEGRPGFQQVEKRIVTLGPSYNGATVITAGLKAGDTLIDEGYRDVFDGLYVTD